VPAPDAGGEQGEFEEPVLDVSVLAELDRLSRDPARLMAVIETFETEGEALLARIAETVAARNHPAFAEGLHALKGNAVNVGAMRLAAACQRTEASGVLDFRQRGVDRVREIGAQLAAARQALRELSSPITNPGYSRP
jgi:HPt (histidine-containing phosphotransfer) domain-containing protein